MTPLAIELVTGLLGKPGKQYSYGMKNWNICNGIILNRITNFVYLLKLMKDMTGRFAL